MGRIRATRSAGLKALRLRVWDKGVVLFSRAGIVALGSSRLLNARLGVRPRNRCSAKGRASGRRAY